MQTKPIQLLRQQVILKALGYYSHKLDGIWGPETIAAKKRFEADVKNFRPGHQNNGLPFSDTGPYPNGIYMEGKGLLTHDLVSKFSTEEKQALADIEGGPKPEGSKPAPIKEKDKKPEAPATPAPAPSTEEEKK